MDGTLVGPRQIHCIRRLSCRNMGVDRVVVGMRDLIKVRLQLQSRATEPSKPFHYSGAHYQGIKRVLGQFRALSTSTPI